MTVVVMPAAMMMVVDADADAERADVGADDVRVRSARAEQSQRKDRSEKRFHEPESFGLITAARRLSARAATCPEWPSACETRLAPICSVAAQHVPSLMHWRGAAREL